MLEWFLKIFIPPQWKGSDFTGVEGGLINPILVERVCTIEKYFQWVPLVYKRVTKKKNTKINNDNKYRLFVNIYNVSD